LSVDVYYGVGGLVIRW